MASFQQQFKNFEQRVKRRLKRETIGRLQRYLAAKAMPLPIDKAYEFDLQGYTILRNFISAEQADRMNDIIDQHQQGQYPRKFPFVELDPLFMAFAADPRILKICEAFSGTGFRLDHIQGVQSPPFEHSPWANEPPDSPELYRSKSLHVESHEGFRYQWIDNRSHGGLMSFGLCLTDIREGDGGFVVVPGSHKQNMALQPMDIQQNHFSEGSSLVWAQPAMNKGDLLIFTEALVHGTAPWLVKGITRRMLYYRYCSGHMCWRKYDEIEKYLYLATTPILKQLLRPPYVAGYDEDDVQVINPANSFRSPTLGDKK